MNDDIDVAACRVSLRGPGAELEWGMKLPPPPARHGKHRPPARHGLMTFGEHIDKLAYNDSTSFGPFRLDFAH